MKDNNRMRTDDGADIPIPRKKIPRTGSISSPPSLSSSRRISNTTSTSTNTSTSPRTTSTGTRKNSPFKSFVAKAKATSEKELDGKQKFEEQEQQLEKLGAEIVKQKQQSPESKSKSSPRRLINIINGKGHKNPDNNKCSRNNNNDRNVPRRVSENTTTTTNNSIFGIPPVPSLGVVHLEKEAATRMNNSPRHYQNHQDQNHQDQNHRVGYNNYYGNNNNNNNNNNSNDKQSSSCTFCGDHEHIKKHYPFDSNVPNCYVYVTNIATNVTKIEFLHFLREMMFRTVCRDKYPKVIRCKYNDITSKSNNNVTNCFNEAYVEFETPEEASVATQMRNRNLKGRNISIKYLPQNGFPQDDNDNNNNNSSERTNDRSCPLSPADAALHRNNDNYNDYIVTVTDRGDDNNNSNNIEEIKNNYNNTNSSEGTNDCSYPPTRPSRSDLRRTDAGDNNGDGDDNKAIGDIYSNVNVNHNKNKNETQKRPLKKRPFGNYLLTPDPPSGNDGTVTIASTTVVAIDNDTTPPAHNDDDVNSSNSDMSMSSDDDDGNGTDDDNEKEDGQIQTDGEEMADDSKNNDIDCSDDQIPSNGITKDDGNIDNNDSTSNSHRKTPHEQSMVNDGNKGISNVTNDNDSAVATAAVARLVSSTTDDTGRENLVMETEGSAHNRDVEGLLRALQGKYFEQEKSNKDIVQSKLLENNLQCENRIRDDEIKHERERKEAEDRFKELKSRYESAESEISGLKTIFTDTITDLNLTKKEVCALTMKLSLKESRHNEDVKQWKKRHDDEVIEKELLINDIKSEYQHEKKGTEDQLNKLQSKFDDVDVKKDNISKKLEESERFVVDTKNTHEAAMKKVIKSNKDLQNRLTKNKKDLQDLKTSYKSLKRETDSLVLDNNDLNVKLQQRNGELKDHRDVRTKLEEENNLYEGDIEDLKNDNRVYKQRFEESESKFEKLIKESIKKDDRINDHEKTIKEIKKELKTKASTKLQARVAVKDDNNNNKNNDTINSLQKRLSQLEQEKDKLLMNCNRASSAFFEEKDKCDEKDKIIKQLQNELKGKTSIKIKIEK
jgi:hypothetical protein